MHWDTGLLVKHYMQQWQSSTEVILQDTAAVYILTVTWHTQVHFVMEIVFICKNILCVIQENNEVNWFCFRCTMKPVPNSHNSVKIAKRKTLKKMRQVNTKLKYAVHVNSIVLGGRYQNYIIKKLQSSKLHQRCSLSVAVTCSLE